MKIGRIAVGGLVALVAVAVLWLALSNEEDNASNAGRNLSSQDGADNSSDTGAQSDIDVATQLLQSGNIAYSNGAYEQAITDYTDALDLTLSGESLTAELYYRRALAYIDVGRWDAALSDFSTVIDHNELPINALVGRGDLYYRLGEYENALSDVEAVLAIEPDNAAARVIRGAIYIARDQHSEAIQDLETVVNLDNDYAPAYFYRSVAHYNTGEQFAALQDLNQAIQLDTQNAAAHYLRGLVYDKEGDDELALSDYSRAIELDPMYSAAYRSRSWIYARQGQVTNVRSDRRNAMLVDPTVAGVSVGDYDLEITRVWATDRANGRQPVDRDQFLVIEMTVYNYATTELCLNRNDFVWLRDTEHIRATAMNHVGRQYYPTMAYPPSSVSHHCIAAVSVWNTFLTYDTYRDIRDLTIEFSPNDESTSLTLLLLPTDGDYAFAISAIDGETVTVVGDVVITNEVRTKVLESRTADLDNCLGASDRSRTDTIEHEEAFNIEIQTTVRHTSGNGAQFESVEANSIRLVPPIPYIDRLLPIEISDLKINLTGQFGDTTTEESITTESSSRVIRSSIAVTTNAAPGTRESTVVTWYLVNKLGYIETTINGRTFEVPFSITDTLEADSVSLPPEACGGN